MKTLKVATFNVNGINTRLSNLKQWLEREQPDIVCLQELKAQDKDFPARELEAAGYGSLHLGQASWNGVAILARDSEPLLIQKGLPGEEKDIQSRYLEAAAHGLIVACLYLPNGNPQPGPKFEYKLRWYEHLIEHAKTLQSSDHPVVLAGDFNVVPTDMDIYNSRSWLKNALLQPESRECFERLLGQGWLDSLRHLYPEERVYTFWDYFRGHWQSNSGLRIDHLLLNPVLAPRLQEAGVDAWVRGEEHASDHAPTWIRIAESPKKPKKNAKKTDVAPSASKSHPNLEEYNRKRDFEATPEPSGAKKTKFAVNHKAKAPAALQFCIQKHDASRLHYDFRLELDGTLKSWAVPKGPSLDPQVKRLAMHVEDHPIDYATFEGSIPEGHYGAGDVIVWDRGVWKPLSDPAEAYSQGRLKFELQGEKLSGLWNLVKGHSEGKQKPWFLIKHQDDFARPESEYDVVKELPDSVLSERTIIAKTHGGKAAAPKPVETVPAAKKKTGNTQLTGAQAAEMPDSIKPELATLVESAPGGDWRYEIKFDGYRIMARIDAGKVQLFTRNGHDWTHKLPRQAEAIAGLALESAWLDGEMVVANDEGVPDFQALQNAFEVGRSGNIVYYLFDLPYLNGMDLREVPLQQRRAALSQLLERSEDDILRFSEDFGEEPDALLNSACQMKMEGLIGKRVGSSYTSRRSGDWIKLKCKRRQEFIVVGYSEPKGARSKFGALLLGLHDADSGELRYAGKVGTGFNEATLNTIFDQLVPLEMKKAAVVNPPTGFEAKGVHWLKPVLLAEVAFAEITKEGSVRHAVFHGMRNDKPAKAITEERPAPPIAEKKQTPSKPPVKTPLDNQAPEVKTAASKTTGKIRLTHPERVIDPVSGSSKRDLADYYIGVSDWLLPELANRPVALVRAPEGIAGELFFQKNADRLAIPGIETMGKEYTGHPVMLINNIEALVGAVQMSTIELHTWNAVSKDLERPDRFILDLDPDPVLPWKSMVEATQLTLTVLDELGLKSFLKTSGGKGIHLVVPLTPKDDWEAVKSFSHAIVKHIAKLLPDRFSAVSGPKNRVGRIFIDYLRNGLGATTACAYGVRTREGLPVSVPIFREELLEIKGANVWNIQNIHERLGQLDKDPWADLNKTRQTITAEMRRRVGLK
ncbi:MULTISPECIES: DNA ligase D [unclassified Pseudomonas]|uniref:DNA ligase D n=1 Tax=unclassified Pseudomonas TaxID=196821 RepID=UPI002AC8BB36|nr:MULTISPECIES: DNA ligase D [unclassified Pseudomonas]MEB0039307.1 DNA ligase D [Pseudomonas sp. MH10]MEB0119746.1 DNA ligase D [Pseudomonas sp. CCI1.2]WPX64914.1 DNA ligase D [Pseudomonas sp. MH10]